jgi:hypothetical protein
MLNLFLKRKFSKFSHRDKVNIKSPDQYSGRGFLLERGYLVTMNMGISSLAFSL